MACSHFGMLAAARWILQETVEPLKVALAKYPTFRLRIVGHSLGAGAAALLTMMYASPGLHAEFLLARSVRCFGCVFGACGSPYSAVLVCSGLELELPGRF